MIITGQMRMPAYPPALDESPHLSDEELACSLAESLREWDGVADLWIFGYGSLIWNPGMPVVETRAARVHGYHRGLYMWSRVNRGTPQTPGLVLALDRGGSCAGVALRLAGAQAMEHLPALWRREMPLGSYRAAWLPCSIDGGERVRALTFVMRRDVPSYAGRLPDEIVRTVLGCAQGRYGSTREYITRTVEALKERGIRDLALESLLHRCG
jgi:cation transport protein ChaC